MIEPATTDGCGSKRRLLRSPWLLGMIGLFMVVLAVVGPFAIRSWHVNRVRTLLEQDGAQVRMNYRGPDRKESIIPLAYDGPIVRALEDEFISITYGTLGGPRCDPDMSLFEHVGRVESVYFYCADVPDNELLHLSHVGELRSLFFTDCTIGRTSLRGLQGLSQLTFLAFYRCPVSDAAVEALGELPSLEYLQLFDCSVSDEGLAALTGLTRLERLELGRSNVTSAGLRHISGLSRLTHLELQECPLSGGATPLFASGSHPCQPVAFDGGRCDACRLPGLHVDRTARSGGHSDYR